MLGKVLPVGLRDLALFALILFVTSSWAATNWHEKVLHTFGSGADGNSPLAGLISDTAGNLYGTTESGGTYNYGTVFELSPTQGAGWTETVLHSFNNNGTDGWYPDAALIFDAAGNLYGTTLYAEGSGAVFELSPSEGGGCNEKVLYTFGSIGDGRYPHGGLVFNAAGNLYGTTSNGGIYCSQFQGCGTVFELSPTQDGGWTETVLHSFDPGADDGSNPQAGLIFDAAGNLYGTTLNGGIHNPGGTVFELTPSEGGGWTETVLYRFGPVPDGEGPWAGLTFDTAGNLYGTTSTGGAYGLGTVFEMTPNGSGSWTETVLHSFGNGTDGIAPFGGLIFDVAGNLYGTASQAGLYNGGTVFEFIPNGSGRWAYTVLYNFGAVPDDGGYPRGGLTFDAAGNLYGMTMLGGANRDGTVFELSPVYPCTRCSHAAPR